MNKLTTALLTSSALLLFTACGGSSDGSSNTPPVDSMTEVDVISIIYGVEEGYCSKDLENQLIAQADGKVDYYLREEGNDVTCATYDRPIGPSTCSEVGSGMGGPVSCVTII